jgi:hypothetical protein
MVALLSAAALPTIITAGLFGVAVAYTAGNSTGAVIIFSYSFLSLCLFRR